mmetsp:Transcript_120678/g.385360  ORF Transcript_120678/g.385360 Transcript_120678/m.385360 type:complete len:223 (+) Transcript_120678:9375-10043(+)
MFSTTSTVLNFSLHSSTSRLQNSMMRGCDVIDIISSESASSLSRTSVKSMSNGQSSREWSKDTVIFDHTELMYFSFFSIFISLPDWSTISLMSSAKWCSSKSSKSRKQNSGPFSKCFFVTALRAVQWRSLIVSLRKSFTKGNAVLIFFTSSSNQVYKSQPFNPLGAALSCRSNSFTVCIMFSVSMFSQTMPYQSWKVSCTKAIMSHKFLRSTRSSMHSRKGR